MPDSKSLLTETLAQAYSIYSRDVAVDDDMLHKSMLRLFALDVECILRKNFGMHESNFNNLFAQEAVIASNETGKLVVQRDDDYCVSLATGCA